MERLKQRIDLARRAPRQLAELAGRPNLTAIERDAAIQRFEHSCGAVWKAVQLHLRDVEGIDVGSPKAAARASFQVRLLDEAETRSALALAHDRNLTEHTYHEELADEIASRLGSHAALLRNWIERVAQRGTNRTRT